MKSLFKFRYPKLVTLIGIIILTYVIFTNFPMAFQASPVKGMGYLGALIAGALFSFGFTTPISIALLVTLAPENIFVAGFIGGFGALCADLIIFHLIRFSFMDEFKRLEKTPPMKKLERVLHHSLGKRLRNYLLFIFAGIIIASPLPDEVGVTMLAGLTKIRPVVFSIISYILNSLGIIAVLILSG